MRTILALSLAAPLALALAGPAAAQKNQPVVSDKASCEQAVKDATAARNGADVSEKVKTEVDEMLKIAEHLCTQANFVYAEQLLAISRGMVAGE